MYESKMAVNHMACHTILINQNNLFMNGTVV